MLKDFSEVNEVCGTNFYDLDPNLRFILDMYLDGHEREIAEDFAVRFGEIVGKKIAPKSEIIDKQGPQLISYDHWGQRISRVEHHPYWLENKADLVRNGISNPDGYAKEKVPSLVNATINYILSQADTAALCALGMTEAAIGIAEAFAPPEVRDSIVAHLSSLDPEHAWEAGMFLTERQGGSDVGANTTKAVLDGDEWRIYGEKFFCSNVDAEIFVVLARPEGAPSGSRGLALFLVPRVLENGGDNNFEIKRLKPKLGTRGVPTGEVNLNGSKAYLAHYDNTGSSEKKNELAKDMRGLVRMMTMVNKSRFGVALMGLGIHKRSLNEALTYSASRVQFGNRIDSYPMVKETLVNALVDYEAAMALTFGSVALNRLYPDKSMLLWRILIPLAKMRATRLAVQNVSYLLEIFGGNGYMEDWPMTRQYRDAQCHPIWEGTENIIALDVRRAMRSANCHEALYEVVKAIVKEAASYSELKDPAEIVHEVLEYLQNSTDMVLGDDEELSLSVTRGFAETLGDVAMAAFLLREAIYSIREANDYRKAVVSSLFVQRRLNPFRFSFITKPNLSYVKFFNQLIRYGYIGKEDL